MEGLHNNTSQLPDDVHALKRAIQDLQQREVRLLQQKEQNEVEFGKKRAKFRELFMSREEELAKEKEKTKAVQEEARKLSDELQKVIAESDGYRTAAALFESAQNEELASIQKKHQGEIASLQHIMSEAVREAQERVREEFEIEKHNLLARNQRLEKEVSTMKSLLNSEVESSRPRVLSGLSDAVTNVIRRNTTSSQNSATDEGSETKDAISLERSMKKAQEDAEAWRSIVMPLEEEISSLKTKLKDSQEKLTTAEAKIKEGESKKSDKKSEREETFSKEQFEELQEKAKELNHYLEAERSSRTDLEMYVAVLNTQKGVLQEDAEKLRKELHNVCRLLEQEKMEHRELKQTWQMANEQFVENLKAQGESFQRVWNVLTPEQRKELQMQQGDPDVGQLIDLRSPQTSPQPTVQGPSTSKSMASGTSASSIWDNIPTVPCTNELAPQPDDKDGEAVAATEENQKSLRRTHSASDIANIEGSDSDLTRTRSAEDLLPLSPITGPSTDGTSTPPGSTDTGISSLSDMESRLGGVSKVGSGKFDWQNFQEAVKFSHQSDMNRSCAMCVNYERQLQRVQDEKQKFQNLASNLQIELDQDKKELFKEQKMRSRLEESVARAGEDVQTQINAHVATNSKLEKLVAGLRENFEATKHEAQTQTAKLVASRDKLTQELTQLRTEYAALQSNAVQQLTQIDPDARLSEMQDQLMQLRAASENTEEKLRSEVTFLKDRAIAEQVAKESLEVMLQSDVDSLKEEVGKLQAELEKERKGKEEIGNQLRKSDQSLKNIEGKSKQVIVALRGQLDEAMNDKAKFEEEAKQLKNQLQAMTEQLNQSEAVQRDFVRLSQSLQMQIAQIQESETEVRWEHLDDAKECRNCKRNLKSPKEKHHCHHCGKVFCEQCTSKSVMGSASAKPHHVCDICHASLNKDSHSTFFNTNLANEHPT